MDNSILITIFTPTYNRADKLVRVYENLLLQKVSNFKWHIIDDGSTDNTKELVQSWQQENKIPIVYTIQANKGKAKSMNSSIKQTTTPLWMCVDSDDWLHNKATEVIDTLYGKIKDETDICGMIGLRKLVNQDFKRDIFIPNDYETINYHHLRYELGIKPEYVEVYKTEIIKKYLYPEIPGENYFPLSYMHDQLSLTYEFLILEKPIMYMEYQDEGMTKKRNELIRNNPIGYMLFKKQLLEMAPTFKVAIISAIAYNSSSILAKQRAPVRTIKGKCLAIITYPISIVDYILRFKFKWKLHLEKTYK